MSAIMLALITASGCGGVRVAKVTDAVRPLRTDIADTSELSPAARFGALFCGMLQHNPDGGTWGPCAEYFSPAGLPAGQAGPPGTSHRVLIVPGIFGQCVEDFALPWEDAVRHLWDAHQLKVDTVKVSALGSSAFNAKQIAMHLDGTFAGQDQRPYIVFGYSKGTSDILEMLVTHPEQRPRVAAVVSIAGSVLGSRLTQGVPKNVLAPLRTLQIGSCTPGDSGGIDSLRRQPRAASVAQLPASLRAYSIAAVSTREKTSKVLQGGWDKLVAFSLEQDSQMLHEDAIVPRGVYLGRAPADHWAVALPFEHVATFHPQTPARLVRRIQQFVDQSRYPRVALFEAALRFVIADLGPPTKQQ